MIGKKPASVHTPYTFHVHSEDKNAPSQLAVELIDQLQNVPKYRDIVIVCIGTDRSTGDSLGPLIGSALEKKRIKHFVVYGTLENPVHAVNLEDTIQEIQCKYHFPYIIAIDACLGKLRNVGKINFTEGPVIPGAAMKKKLPEVGEMHITGIVNVSGMMEYFVLQNTRLHLVMTMAECTAEAFQAADRKLRNKTRSITAGSTVHKSYYKGGSSETESAFSLQDPN
ncbi:spore protease YyaC [Salibacterium aidingense]|uniref:spore protease YyaC n=1 Tax=Salibacterium aidingense TaxID=384933 RepID=UPI00040762EB|nr:spore protease YyaC [Salibacterium aidingense]